MPFNMKILARQSTRRLPDFAWSCVLGQTCLILVAAAANAFGDVAVKESPDGGYRVEFRYRPKKPATSVTVAAEFNSWNHRVTLLTGPDAAGWWSCEVPLAKGRYEYKFVVDRDQWYFDPGNPRRSGERSNSVVYVGIPAPDKEADPPPASPGGRKPKIVDLPADVKELGKALTAAGPERTGEMLPAWLKTHRMPLITDSAIAFVLGGPPNGAPVLKLIMAGQEEPVPLQLIGPGAFAVAIDPKSIPERSAYYYELQQDGKTTTVLDANAWSFTSRADHPAAAIVKPDKTLGRIEIMLGVQPIDKSLPPRDIYVYLPAGYDDHPDWRYPVLYMHDGQNCLDDPVNPFGRGGWDVNRIADGLIKTGKIRPFIGVAIANSADRLREYGPGPDTMDVMKHPYLHFVLEELKPAIDARYRTQPEAVNTAMMGSSLGAAISFQAALTEPGKVGAALCLSPAFQFPDAAGKTYADLVVAKKKAPVRLYIDHGTGGPAQDGAQQTRAMVNMVRAAGWIEGNDFQYVEEPGATHDERAWRRRLPGALTFLYGSRKP
jgi:predicted alpha/beta superfamily hydrolase